jgi:hypothetical protein
MVGPNSHTTGRSVMSVLELCIKLARLRDEANTIMRAGGNIGVSYFIFYFLFFLIELAPLDIHVLPLPFASMAHLIKSEYQENQIISTNP